MIDFLTTYGLPALMNYGPKVLGAILTLYIWFKVLGRLDEVIIKIFEKSHIDVSVARFLSSFLEIIAKGMLLIMAAGMVGVETSSFIAIFWAAWLAIWLALQGSLANFAGGLLILVLKPYKVGDIIEAKDQRGEVVDITIFTTKLMTSENNKVIIPNGEISNNVIINYSDPEDTTIEIPVTIVRSKDLQKTISLLLQVLADLVPNQKNQVYIKEQAVGGIVLLMKTFVWLKERRKKISEILQKSLLTLGDADIELSYLRYDGE
jgi:small conductance mechanosensitive channel